MKRIILLMNTLLLVSIMGAQGMGEQGKRAELEAKKIAFISDAMELTPEEAKVFWPVYNQLEEERKALRKEMKASKPDGPREDLSDAEIETAIRNQFKMKRKEIDIQEKYFEEFKKILPSKKIAKLYFAEERFKRSVLEEFKKQRGERDRDRERRRP